MPSTSAQNAGVAETAAPWLEFAVHHRSGSNDGLKLAAEASLRGTLAVLVGPSGAGKTSLLRAISGLLRPERGQIRVMGTTVYDSERGVWTTPPERGCGLVTQRPALFPALTVAENIAFGLQAFPREGRKLRVDEMAALFRLESLRDRRPAQLSGGEQQRVSVARTLAPRPQVLLLDEPFAGLNLALKDAILTDLERWLGTTRTPALYVTHDVADAWRMGMREGAEVLRMEAGRVVQQGAAAVLAEERTRLLRSLK
jgi:ABC-type sulfate/molybdate transport systems ATPase subunit